MCTESVNQQKWLWNTVDPFSCYFNEMSQVKCLVILVIIESKLSQLILLNLLLITDNKWCHTKNKIYVSSLLAVRLLYRQIGATLVEKDTSLGGIAQYPYQLLAAELANVNKAGFSAK